MAEKNNTPNEPEEKVLVENNDAPSELPLIKEETLKNDASTNTQETSRKGGKKKTSKTVRKYIIYISMMVIVSALAFYFVMKNDPGAVIDAIAKCNINWILGAFGVIIASFLVEGLILMILARMYKPKYPFYKGVLNTMIGTFFSGITPSNSGGQFVQAYTFSKQGIKITNAASILFMHFIIYQSVLVLFGAGVLVFKFNEMSSLTQAINIFGFEFDIIVLALIGFGINVIVIVGLFFLAFSKRIHNFIIKYGIGLLAKLKIVKNKEERIVKLNTRVETFRIELKRLLQNWKVLISTALLFLLKMILLNCVPYFLAHAIPGMEFTSDNELWNFINTTSMTTLVSTITAMVPIPGASGGAELVFSFMFGGDFFVKVTSSQLSALVLLWRSVSFYLGLIIGFIVFVSYHESPKKESFLHGDARTLLEINVINLDEDGHVSEKRIKQNQSIMHIEPQMLTIDDIEAHFAALKDDLYDQLSKNEESLFKEKKKSKRKKKE